MPSSSADYRRFVAVEGKLGGYEILDDLKRSERHYGPGDHPSGTPQAAHGGGKATADAAGSFKPHGDHYEAMQQHAEVAARRWADRSPTDQMSVETYQSQTWLEINDPLRAGKNPPDDYMLSDGADYHRTISDLDRMMTSEGGLPFDAYVYRGVHSDNVFPARNLTGERFKDLGYVSTTTDKDMAMSFSFPGNSRPAGTIVVIKARKGQPAILLDYEILLPRGTTLKITMDGKDRASGARIINAEIVP